MLETENCEIKNHLNNVGSKINVLVNQELKPNFKDVFVIIDTNILISHLDDVKRFIQKNKERIGTQHNDKKISKNLIYVIIPWIVIQELDLLKSKNESDSSIAIKSRESINYLLTMLNEKCEFLYFQTSLEVRDII